MTGFELLFFCIAILFCYFAPTILALGRGKSNAVAIATLNFFLGWTMVGWVVALVWALTVEGSN